METVLTLSVLMGTAIESGVSITSPELLWGSSASTPLVSTLLGLSVLVGLSVAGNTDGPIERLTAKVRRVTEREEPVDFGTDRDDEIGELYRAVGELVDASDICERERSERYRKRLYEIASDPGLDEAETIDRMLELGCDRLGLQAGIVTSIDEESGRYEIERASDNDFVSAGTVADLSETFCRNTITGEEVLGIFNATASGYEDDPGYTKWGISCYLGSKLVVDDELHGTLCFVDSDPRERDFTHAEKAFVDLMGRWISNAIERRQRLAALERDSSLLDSLFEQLPVSLYVKDEDGRHVRKAIADRNDPYPDEEEQYLGKTDLELYPDEHASETHADDMQVIESGEPIVRKTEFDPETKEWFVTSKVPWRGEDGDIRGLIGITQQITEEKQYERQIEALVENTPNPIFIKDREGRYQFINEAGASTFGVDPEEAIGKTDEELFDDGSIETSRADDRRVVETGETVTTETTVTFDDEQRFYIDNKYPYRDEDGEIIGVMGISQDITERKERERRLAERERELSTLISNVPGMVYRCKNEPDWPFEFVSDGCRELTGYEPSEIVSGEVNWAEDVLEDDNEELWETVQRAIEDREQFQVSYRIEAAGGETRWLQERGTGVFDDGELVGLEGVIIDITEREEQKRELQATNERLNAVIEASPDAIMAVDTEGVTELWNPAAEEIFGWSEAEVLGDRLPFVPEDRREEAESFLDRLLAGETIAGVEVQRLTRDGDRIDTNLSAAPLYDDEVVGIMAVMEDITERKEKERQLQERERELERYRQFTEDVLDAVDDVFYVVDSDGRLQRWNSALPAVTGYSDAEIESMVATDFFGTEDGRRIVDAIETALETRGTVVEAPFLTKDDRVVPHEFIAVRIENPDGESVVAGIGRDITERKQREQELERTADLLSRAEEMADIGGWATTIEDGESVTTEWTDSQYDLFGLSQGSEPLTEGVFEYFHPDDRERHQEAIARAVDLGVGWDQELRIIAEDGTERWVRNIGEPVIEDGDVVELRGSMQDITEQKHREQALESLYESTRDLLTTESITEATELMVDTADSILGFAAVGIYRYDETANQLTPSAVSEEFERYCLDGVDAVGPDTESFVWHTYVTGTLSFVEGVESSTETELFTDEVATRIAVPIGTHGVFVGIDREETVSDADRHLTETLVATTEVALDRHEKEQELRRRDAEIEAQNERLRRQVRINETIRSVDQSLIGATSRADLETAVCERLVDAEDISFAWIGVFDAAGEHLEPRAWAGDGQSYLDSVSLARTETAREPAVETAVEGTPTVIENVARNVQREGWRQAALAADFQSILAVPVTLEEDDYGVLTVYADDPDAFGELETTVFTELSQSIANAIASITTRQALYSDTVTALELSVEGAPDLLTDISTETGCTVEYEGLATVSTDRTRLFVRVSGCDHSTVRAVLDDRHAVSQYQIVSEGEDGTVLEVTVEGETIVSRLVQHGGRPQRIVAEGGTLSIEVDVPTSTDVRSFVATLGEDGTVDLRSKQERSQSLQSGSSTAETLLSALTDRQREVLRTAYHAGFFNWPRDTTGEELAVMLDVSQPTVNRHLRLAQQRITAQLFDGTPETG